MPNLRPIELKWLEDHKLFYSRELGREALFDETFNDFIDKGYLEKCHKLALEERIEQQKKKIIENNVTDPAEIKTLAENYAQQNDSLEGLGFHTLYSEIQNKTGVHLRPMLKMIALAKAHQDCDIYISTPKMGSYNFTLEGRPYVHLRSSKMGLIISLLDMNAPKGTEMHSIFWGNEAERAKTSLDELIKGKFEETE